MDIVQSKLSNYIKLHILLLCVSAWVIANVISLPIICCIGQYMFTKFGTILFPVLDENISVFSADSVKGATTISDTVCKTCMRMHSCVSCPV